MIKLKKKYFVTKNISYSCQTIKNGIFFNTLKRYSYRKIFINQEIKSTLLCSFEETFLHLSVKNMVVFYLLYVEMYKQGFFSLNKKAIPKIKKGSTNIAPDLALNPIAKKKMPE